MCIPPIPECCRAMFGHYQFDEVHIDLRPLAQFAGARLYHDEALRIDKKKNSYCKVNSRYDVLSIKYWINSRDWKTCSCN